MERQNFELAQQVRNLQKQKKPLPQITALQKRVKELTQELSNVDRSSKAALASKDEEVASMR